MEETEIYELLNCNDKGQNKKISRNYSTIPKPEFIGCTALSCLCIKISLMISSNIKNQIQSYKQKKKITRFF